jgi:hypothetical protein
MPALKRATSRVLADSNAEPERAPAATSETDLAAPQRMPRRTVIDPDDEAGFSVGEDVEGSADADLASELALDALMESLDPDPDPFSLGTSDDDDDEDEDEGRSADLAPSEPVLVRPRDRHPLTPEQRRVRESYYDHHAAEHGDYLYAGVSDGDEPPETYRAAPFRESFDTGLALADQNRELAKLTEANIGHEIITALARVGVSRDDLPTAFPKKGGRPPAARLELRSRIRAALDPIYHEGRSRELMRAVLGISRETLHKLMTPKP